MNPPSKKGREPGYAEAVRLYADTGLSCAQVCRECGIDYTRFYRYLHRFHGDLLESRKSVRPHRALSPWQKSAKSAARHKYAAALRLYATTDLSLREICRRTGVSANGFSWHVRRYHRDLLLRRNGMEVSRFRADHIRLHKNRDQSLRTHAKYRDAVSACGDEKWLGYTVSEIARSFSLDATALGNQLRLHYPETVAWRERERALRGLGDGLNRGARPKVTAQYAEAVEMLRRTDLTVKEVAELYGVSSGGLRQHLNYYHKDVLSERSSRRRERRERRESERRESVSVRRRYRRSTAEKYADAIGRLRRDGVPVSQAAQEHGVQAENLRRYVREHEPELWERLGMRRGADGRRVSVRSVEKYADAIAWLGEHRGSGVKEAASRHGLVYTSFYAFLRRNHPDLLAYGQPE